MIRLFLTLIVIFAFICVLTVIISIRSQKTVYPMVSVICGVLIIALAFCCVIETESEGSGEAPSKAYIPVTESVTVKRESDSTPKANTAKEKTSDVKTESDDAEPEEEYENEVQPVKRVIPGESGSDDMNRTVYITKTGKKYHFSYFCSNTDFYECTLEQALDRGLEPCQKCVK